jgi:hypothetical protein
MRAAFWRAPQRPPKAGENGPDRIFRAVVGLVFVALFVTVIVVLLWARLHQ